MEREYGIKEIFCRIICSIIFLFLAVRISYAVPATEDVYSSTSQIDEQIADFYPSASYPITPTPKTINVPVILINFNDTATTYSDTDIHDLILDDATDTNVRAYFYEVSYGDLIFNDTDVVSWGTAGNGHNDYGFTHGNELAAALVREAVVLADATFDFSPFDNDGDGDVDGVIVVHQGTGMEESGFDTDIWSHTWSLSAATGVTTYATGDAVTVDTYIICPEILYNDGSPQIMTIGVFCHEFGHLLGLPELYDRDKVTQGIGDWDTMAFGCWNGTPEGSSPAHFSAWCKYLLGWVTPNSAPTTQIGRPVAATTIEAVEDDKTKVYQFLTNTNGVADWTPYGGGAGEYFLIENRQASGFDAGLPGFGLLIWHIDESIGNNDADPLGVGDVEHKLVDLEEADGLEELDFLAMGDQGDSGDPYPGATSNTDFNLQENPDNELYDGTCSEARVENIALSDTDISAELFMNKDPELSGAILDPDSGDTETFFEFYVDYEDDDSDTPASKSLIIDDGDGTTTYSMPFQSGSGTVYDGTYEQFRQLDPGTYTHYFLFDDGQGGVTRLPSSGNYSGPTIAGEEVEEPEEEVVADTDEEDFSLVQWHCFIATASYDTPMAKEVKILCEFRDSYLMSSPFGRGFVKFYYKFSPAVAEFISRHPFLKKCVRGLLMPIVEMTKELCPPTRWDR